MKSDFMLPEKVWSLILIIVFLTGVCSCTNPVKSPSSQSELTESSPADPVINAFSVDEAIVQIWDSGVLAATGVAIGDGNQVLTVLNFEVSIPDSLDIVATSGERYPASIQAIDPRTGATLLKAEAASLPVASTGDAASLVSDQQVIAHWYQQPYTGDISGESELEKTELLILPDSVEAGVNFGVYFPPGTMPDIPNVKQGAVITDDEGVVLGLLGVDYNKMFPHPHGIGMLPRAAGINSALALLSPDFAKKPYANGPLMIVIDSESGTQFFLSYFPNYDVVTGAIKKISHRLGMPLSVEELPQDYHSVTIIGPRDHNTVTVVYALPVELTSSEGVPLGRAKWVSIQWNRASGEPNLLFYGSGHWNLGGGFRLPDDLSDLLAAIDPLIHYQPSL